MLSKHLTCMYIVANKIYIYYYSDIVCKLIYLQYFSFLGQLHWLLRSKWWAEIGVRSILKPFQTELRSIVGCMFRHFRIGAGECFWETKSLKAESNHNEHEYILSRDLLWGGSLRVGPGWAICTRDQMRTSAITCDSISWDHYFWDPETRQ